MRSEAERPLRSRLILPGTGTEEALVRAEDALEAARTHAHRTQYLRAGGLFFLGEDASGCEACEDEAVGRG